MFARRVAPQNAEHKLAAPRLVVVTDGVVLTVTWEAVPNHGQVD